MAAPNAKNEAEREAHLVEVARLYRRKHAQNEIARLLDTTPQSISRDIAILKERWKAEAVASVAEVQAEILANLDAVEEEAWEAWRRSQADAEKVVTRRVTADEGEGDADGGFVIDRTRFGQYGDPRFLEQIRKIQEDRAKIYGVNAPTKVAPTDPTGTSEYLGLSDAELIEKFNRLYAAINAGGASKYSGDDSGGGA